MAVAHSATEIQAVVGTKGAQRTVKNRLLQGQLLVRRLVARIPLTLSHCRLRRQLSQYCHSLTAFKEEFSNRITVTLTPLLLRNGLYRGLHVTLACEITRSVCNGAHMGNHWMTTPVSSTAITDRPSLDTTNGDRFNNCQVIYSQFGLAIHQNDHQARRRFVEWAENEIAVVPDFHKRILFSDEAHFWLNGYVNKQNCRIWSEANPQVYVETPLHPETLTVWCALWAGGILLQKR
ncbi:hypothetical protein TNCV_2655961 [Trichonephila clavipes]|nr:hypothetical protein TNCV_2655961 [Trichonephila clavipes]